MTNDEKFDLILSKLDNVDKRLDTIDERLDTIDERLDTIDEHLDTIDERLDTLEKSAYLLENDIAPKVQVLLESYSDLSKNVLVAKGIEERVGTLEFDVKALKDVVSKLTA